MGKRQWRNGKWEKGKGKREKGKGKREKGKGKRETYWELVTARAVSCVHAIHLFLK
jgi:hypothetical protein